MRIGTSCTDGNEDRPTTRSHASSQTAVVRDWDEQSNFAPTLCDYVGVSPFHFIEDPAELAAEVSHADPRQRRINHRHHGFSPGFTSAPVPGWVGVAHLAGARTG